MSASVRRKFPSVFAGLSESGLPSIVVRGLSSLCAEDRSEQREVLPRVLRAAEGSAEESELTWDGVPGGEEVQFEDAAIGMGPLACNKTWSCS